MTSGVYEIINKISGKKYIGSSVDIYKRFREHFYHAPSKTNAELRNDMVELGIENFSLSIVEVFTRYCSESSESFIVRLQMVEQDYIDAHDPDVLYNSPDDFKRGPTAEVAKAASVAMKEYWRKKKIYEEYVFEEPLEAIDKIEEINIESEEERAVDVCEAIEMGFGVFSLF